MRRFLPTLLAIPLFLLAQDAPTPPQKKGMMGPPKNLKLLKPETLLPAMQAFRIALDQQCSYCHVMGNFASDDNPKKITARHMIEMVSEINAKFPDGKEHVTCYTCHRGTTVPVTTPPPAQ
jgi:photosynthetic reaction center cytochrome c subunit